METELLTTLRHPNIVACYGSVAVPEPDLHIVLEFCTGGTLRERISRGDYDAETALSWLLDVAKGCAFLHEHSGVRLAHRDIKPENLMISAEGTVKIADFGLCKAEIHPGTPAGVRVVHNLPRSSPPKTAYKVSRTTVKPDDAEASGHSLELVAAKGRSAILAPPGSKAHVSRISRGWSARRSAEAERTSQQSDFSLRISAASVSSSGSAKSGRPKRASLQSVVNTSAWGLAFKLNMVGAQYVEMTGQTGSSLYMAPENYLGKPYTNKVDIFSFSIIMVEVLARRRAYEGLYLTPDMIAHAVAHKNLRPKIPSRWPANVQCLVRACWDEDPAKRPSSREIMRQLEHLIACGKKQPELLAALEARRPGGCFGGMFGK